MLSIYTNNYASQLITISNALYCPFTSVGFIKTLKKNVLETSWVTAKKFGVEQKFSQPDINQLISYINKGVDDLVISQACIEIMANLPQSKNLIFINSLINEPALKAIAKLIISKVLLQQHSLNLIPYIDINTLAFAFSSNDDLIEFESVSNFFIELDTTKEITTNMFDLLCKNGLVNSPLMSLYLLSINWEQVNIIGNYASNTLSMDHTLQVLLQSCFVKVIPLANASLNELEQPAKIIALIRYILGDKLDMLVDFDIQLSAWRGSEASLEVFIKQLQMNWSKHEDLFCHQRLIAGQPLDTKRNAIEMSAMDSYSQAVLNLYTYYFLAAKKHNQEVS
ncbi:hypothetical protein V5096_17915 [Pseudoalteromonas carrageenovora]|uniref:hypothetical protein n=1 Tax=Pseudoalteromonas carrageenovora TaxID=227 RepID=UPI002FD155A9